MAFPDVLINQTNGGSGRGADGVDFYSGLIFYGTAPVVTGKWTTYPGPPQIAAQQIFSPADAQACGIIPNTDNVASTATYLITAAGATGNTGEFKVTVPIANGGTTVISLGVYTVTAAQTTIALQGAAWAAVINAGTLTHGWSATFNTATITLIAPKSAGVSLNTGTPYAATVSGTLAGTLTQAVIAGTVSKYAIWYYHISEFFRVFPTGNIWVGIISASSSFDELTTLQQAATSKLRQIGIFDDSTTRGSAANITGTVTQIDVAAKKSQQKAPYSVVYSPNIKAVTDLSTYPDQNLNTANKVQCVLSQDGLAAGALLYVQCGMSIGNVGAKLASIAKSRVSASDAQPIPDFNMSDGVENNTPAFGNGLLLSAVASSLQVQLDAFNYTFFRQFGDQVVGTYWTGNKCCVSSASDYANINDNRVSDKVSRILYSVYIPKLNSELIFKSDGTLQDYTIESFKDDGEDAVSANMIIGFGALPLISGIKIDIDPAQPVKQTNNLTVDCFIVQNGIARKITVNISYALTI